MPTTNNSAGTSKPESNQISSRKFTKKSTKLSGKTQVSAKKSTLKLLKRNSLAKRG